jgi:hypothetical protein
MQRALTAGQWEGMQGEVGDSDKHDIRGVQKALTAGQCTAMQADRGG